MRIELVKFTLVICFSILAFANFSLNAQICSPAPVGLVSWYSGDGNALDSRSRNNGTLGASSQFAAGQVGQAFQTTSTTGSAVTAPDSTSLDFTNAFTIEMWVSLGQVGANNGTSFLACKGNCGSIGSFPYSLVLNNTTSNVIFRVGDSSTFDSLFSSALPLNTFTHLAVSYERSGASGTMRIYLNGVLDGSKTTSIGTLVDSDQPLTIGGSTGSGNTPGIYDEASFYSRVLSASEIQAIANAGTAGKCKPTTTVAPNNQITWLTGDGNALDSAGTNNGALQNGAGFAVGKVGQSFNFDGSNDFVGLGDPANLKFTNTNFTVEGWFMTPDIPNNPGTLCGARYPIFGYDFGYTVEIVGDGRLRLRKSTSQPDTLAVSTLNPLSTNVFHHFAAIHTPTEMRLYVDGVLDNTLAIANGNIFYIGGDVPELGRFDCGPNDFYFKGKIDETSIYNRSLTDAEITSIFNAGIAGKLKENATTGTTATVGDATVTFAGAAVRTTQEIPLAAAGLPPLAGVQLMYDVATSVAAASPTVCFNLPALTQPQFVGARIFHLENNIWQDRTAAGGTYPSLCTTGLTSLSPFAITGAAPTVAAVLIGGRVTSASGRGILRAQVSLTDASGMTRQTYTNSFGYYRFNDVPAGETYIFSVSHKVWQFTQNTQIQFVSGEDSGINFTGH